MKIFLIAGEASGDVHGANLMKAILIKVPDCEFEFWGGEKMAAVSNGLKKHYKDLAFMGFVEVIQNLSTIRKNFILIKKQILEFNPDKIIFIDYPGFNLRLCKWVHFQNIETIYYIAPQIWAWHKSRIKTIKKYIDKMFVILPFEKDFFDQYNYETTYVGNPVLDEIDLFVKDEKFLSKYNLSKGSIVAILPGSREQEIIKILPIMLEISRFYPELIFCIAVKGTINPNIYEKCIPTESARNIRIIKDDQYNLLSNAKAALVTSGTATLETALFDVPMVVCYKANALTVSIARKLVNIKYISLVNLIIDKPAVTELIQNDLNSSNLKKELDLILGSKSIQVKSHYKELKNILGTPGASSKIAKILFD